MKITWILLVSMYLSSLDAAADGGKANAIRNLPILSSCIAPERNKELTQSLHKFFGSGELLAVRQLIIKGIAPALFNLQKMTAASKLGPQLQQSAEKYYRLAIKENGLTPEKLNALKLSLKNISSSQAFSKAQIQTKLLAPLTFLTAVQQGKKQTNFVTFERALRVFISSVDEYMTKISLYQELLKTAKNPQLQQALKNASGQILRLNVFANKLRNDTDSILGFMDKGAQVLCSPADYLKALGIGEHDVHGGMHPTPNNHNPFGQNIGMGHHMQPHMGGMSPQIGHHGMMSPPMGMRSQMGPHGFNPAMGQGRPPMGQHGMMPPPMGMRPPMGQPGSYPGMVGQQGRPPMPQQPMMSPPPMGQPSSYPEMVGQQGRPPMQPPLLPPAMIPGTQQTAPVIYPQLSINPNMQPGRINPGVQQLGLNTGIGQGIQQPIMCPLPGINPGQPGGLNFNMLPGSQGAMGGGIFGGINQSMQQPLTCPQPSMNQAQWFNSLSQTGEGRAHTQSFGLDSTDLDDDDDDLDDEDMDGVMGSQQFNPRSSFHTQHGIPFNQYGQFANQGMFINTQDPYQPYIGNGFAPSYGTQTSHQAYPTQCIVGGQFGNGQNPYMDVGYSAGIHQNGFYPNGTNPGGLMPDGSYPNGTNPGGLTPGSSTCSPNLPSNGVQAAPTTPAGSVPASTTCSPSLPANGVQAASPTQESAPSSAASSSSLPSNEAQAAPTTPAGSAPASADQQLPPQSNTTPSESGSAPTDQNSAANAPAPSTDPEVAAAEQKAAQLAVESAKAAEDARQKASLAAEESARQAAEERQRANQLAEESRKQAAEEQRKAEELAQQADLEAAEKQRKAAELEKEAQRAAAAIPPSAIDENGVAKVYADTPPIVSAKTGATEAVVGRDIEDTEGVQIVYAETTTPILVKNVTHDQATALQERATNTPPAAVVAPAPPAATTAAQEVAAQQAAAQQQVATQQAAAQQQIAAQQAAAQQQVAAQQQKVAALTTNAQQSATAAVAAQKSVFGNAISGFKGMFSRKKPA